MNRSRLAVQLLALAGTLLPPLAAQQITDRGTLNQLLGAVRIAENFEGTPFEGSAPLPIGPLLDRSLGPVEAGASYHSVTGLRWSSAWLSGNGGLTSKAIGLAPGTNKLNIDYALPVPAAGLDVVVRGSSFPPTLVTVDFKDAGGVLLGTVQHTISSPGTYEFAGWQHAAGISSVQVSGTTGSNYGIYIDDHTYGLSPADAGQKSSYGRGCNIWRATFYEQSSSFALSGHSLTMNLVDNSHYAVSAGSSPVVPPSASPWSPTNGHVQAFPLGWTLRYPGGMTDTLYVGSNGFVRFAFDSFTYITSPGPLLQNGPTVSALGRRLDPEGGGTVTFETDPVAQSATVTFDQVPDENSTATNTFQFYFDGSGTVEMRFGNCAPTAAMTGWSPGAYNFDPGSVDLLATVPFTTDPEDRVPIVLTTVDYPYVGGMLDLEIVFLRVGTLATVYAFGSTVWPGIDLAAFGMPRCSGWISPWASHVTTNPSGTISHYLLTIPNAPALVGQSLSAQGFALDPAGGHNALGGLTTNGLRLDIGWF